MKKTNQDKSFLQAINDAIVEEMELDNQVVIIGEDIGTYGGAFGVTRGLLEKFGSSRVIDTPISENSIVGLATGAAITGLRPIVEIMFMDFITLAMDQIVNHMTKLRYMYGGQVTVPVVIRTPAGAGRRYGASHSQSLLAWFMHIPGIKIAVPSNSNDAKHILKYAIQDPNPWLFIEAKKLYYTKSKISNKLETPIGQAKIITKGKDCTIITFSIMTMICSHIIDQINNEGKYSLELIDLRTLAPLDYDTIYKSVRKTKNAVIVEEGYLTCGVGAEISSKITENCFSVLNKSVLRIASEDVPVPASPVLEDHSMPNSDKIFEKLEKFLKK